jgi:hypothetical protein
MHLFSKDTLWGTACRRSKGVEKEYFWQSITRHSPFQAVFKKYVVPTGNNPTGTTPHDSQLSQEPLIANPVGKPDPNPVDKMDHFECYCQAK